MDQKNMVLAGAMLVVGIAVGYGIGSKHAASPAVPVTAHDGAAPVEGASNGMPSGMQAEDPNRVPVDIAAMDERLKKNPNDVDAFLSILEEHAAQGHAEAVVPKLADAEQMAANDVPSLIRLAVLAKKVGQGAAAMSAAERAIRKDGRSAEAYHIAGTVAWHDLGDNERAIRYWNKYLELDPQAPNGEMIRKTIEQLKSGTAPAMGAMPAMGNSPTGAMPAGHVPVPAN